MQDLCHDRAMGFPDGSAGESEGGRQPRLGGEQGLREQG